MQGAGLGCLCSITRVRGLRFKPKTERRAGFLSISFPPNPHESTLSMQPLHLPAQVTYRRMFCGPSPGERYPGPQLHTGNSRAVLKRVARGVGAGLAIHGMEVRHATLSTLPRKAFRSPGSISLSTISLKQTLH